jgi:predicted nucleic acid-binding protein
MRNSSATCVDASCVVHLVAGEPTERETIQRLWDRWTAEGRVLVAPLLLRYEVTNALHRYAVAGNRTILSVEYSLVAALDLPIRLHGDTSLHTDALRHAARFSLPAAYDAHYLALAERLGADFWTTDRKLVNAVRAELPWVHLVGE